MHTCCSREPSLLEGTALRGEQTPSVFTVVSNGDGDDHGEGSVLPRVPFKRKRITGKQEAAQYPYSTRARLDLQSQAGVTHIAEVESNQGLPDEAPTKVCEPQCSSARSRKPRRVPAKTKQEKARRAIEREKARKQKHAQPSSWTCPVPNCEWTTTGTYAGVIAGKHWHGKHRHPEMSKKIFASREPQAAAIPTSAWLPPDQRGWECPICKEGLPSLEKGLQLRSIKQHCLDSHPKETPHSLYCKRQKNQPKAGTSAYLKKAHAEARAKNFPTHDIVEVTPHEKVLAGWRGSLYYCTKCLSTIGKNNEASKLTCQEFQDQLAASQDMQAKRRNWWSRLKHKQPLRAEALIIAVGKTYQEMDEACFANSIASSSRGGKAPSPKPTGAHPRKLKAGKKQVWVSQNKPRRPRGAQPQGRTSRPARGRAEAATSKARSSVTGTRHLGGRGPRAGNSKLASAATWRLGGFRAVRVGEARHPGPRSSFHKFSLLTLNVGGPTAAWQALEHFAANKEPVVMAMQETKMQKREWEAFNRFGFFTVAAERWGKDRCRGGVCHCVPVGRQAPCFPNCHYGG